MSAPLERFLASAPQPQRGGMRVLVALARRPRGARLVARAGGAEKLARALLAIDRYDDPAIARALGWDAEAVSARGRALRRAEGRP
jgi:hypothetical protein